MKQAKNTSSLLSFYNWFEGYPIFIQIAIVVICVSVILLFLSNIGLFVKRVRDARYDRRLKKAERLVMTELTGGLILEDEESERDFSSLVRRIKRLVLRDKLFSQVVIDQVVFYHHNFTDHAERFLEKLFRRLNLVDNIISKLKNRDWELKAKGLKEVQEMQPAQNLDEHLTPLLNDRNNDLRVEAQAAHIRMHPDNPFNFLLHATEELREWHQILLFDTVTNSPELAIPEFGSFLYLKNDSVVSFCIKLIDHYQQLESIPDLIALMDHPTEQIRGEVICVLGKLDAEDAEELMITNYPNETIKIQRRILTALGDIGSGKNLPFLKEQFLVAADFALVKTAGCALANYPTFDKEELLQEVNEEEERDSLHRRTILNHCTNVLIRN